ncbi:unnamed protein product [Sphagnum troendelagicum]|uniref:C3H1-type domain-containing protein n=1 Tax=Sphagnum troendelagicum TaxID=128251 RepID=A0ABP0TLM6_9BRYO
MEVDDGPTRVGGKRNYPRSGNPGGAGARSHHPQICRYWQEGRCLKGDDCQWLHPGNPGTTGRGTFLGNGRRASNVIDNRSDNRGGWGTTGEGGFSSGSSSQGRSRNVSARWGRPRNVVGRPSQRERGYTDGSGGGHTQRSTKGKPCNFWLKGNCNRGDDCMFLHAHTTAPDIQMMTQLIGHEKAIRAIEMPQGASQLYTGSQDESVRVWDCTTGQCTNVVQMGGDVGALLSAPGWLFIGLPNEVQTWNVQTSAQQSLSGPKGQVHALAVSEDGLLFAGTQDGTILEWKFNALTHSFEPAASLSGHTGPVITLLFIGNRLYTGSMDKTIRIWDTASGQCIQTLEGHSDVVMDLLCWEQFLLSCSLDGTIRVWAANAAGQLDTTFTHPEDEGQAEPRNGALKMCGCNDGAGKPVLLVSYNDNIVRLYDLPTFSERGQLFSREEVRALHVGPGGLVFSGDSCGTVKVWRWTGVQLAAGGG